MIQEENIKHPVNYPWGIKALYIKTQEDGALQTVGPSSFEKNLSRQSKGLTALSYMEPAICVKY